MSEYKICRRCGAQLDPDDNFCMACGAPTSEDFLVAGSIIGASFKIALAMDILCLSPPESLCPFSPIMVSMPSGILSINS